MYVLTFIIILSCVRKHKFDSDKKQLSEQKMKAILTDVFLMEAYVNEKMQGVNADSLTVVKQSFYKDILKHHKADSVAFYSTFNYYQTHPKEFIPLLNLVDSTLNKIIPLDTAFVKPIVLPPKNLDILPNFKQQEAAMQKEYLKKNQNLQKNKRKNNENNQ